MDCCEYIDRYLSANADDQLSKREQMLVEAHLAECAECRQRLEEERALKAAVHHGLGIVKAPADVRLRIRAALGEPGEQRPGRRGTSARVGDSTREASADRQRSRGWSKILAARAHYLAPVGLALIVLAVSVLFTAKHQAAVVDRRSVPAFDFAIGRFKQLSQDFAPNVPPEAFSEKYGASFAWVMHRNPLRHVSVELPDISVSYEKAQMPPERYDFVMAGYRLDGGRVDHLANGNPVTYTLYHRGRSALLSISLKRRMGAPQLGAYWFETHALYSYKGYSICFTDYSVGHFISIVITREPVLKLLRDVAAADIAFIAQ